MAEHAPGVALITGANRGLGLETAKRLAERGWRVIVAARDAKAAEKAARALPGPAKHASIALDVTKVDAKVLAREVTGLAPDGIDALVNNAGVYGEGGKSGARNTIETNFFGPLRVTDALRPVMRIGANVVNVTSGLGALSNFPAERRKQLSAPTLERKGLLAILDEYLRDLEGGHPSQAGWPTSYSVSKGALNALTRVLANELAKELAKELAPAFVKVNAVCPGWVRTRMGGSGAPRTIEEGAAGIVWAATLPEGGPSGGVFRDGEPVPP